MIALDANIFIYFLESNPEFGEQARALLQDVLRQNIVCSASDITLMEILSGTHITAHDVQTMPQKLAEEGIRFEPVSREILLMAAELRRENGLGAFDAVHVASAREAGCTHFITNDQTLLKKHVKGLELVPLANAQKIFL